MNMPVWLETIIWGVVLFIVIYDVLGWVQKRQRNRP